MPYANNEGVRIYYDVEGGGPPLVLLPGMLMAAQSWRGPGCVEALATDYRTIMVDPRGQGASDKPLHPEDYRLEKMVGDVVTVLDCIGVRKAHFFGFSMGGWVGWGITQLAPERALSLLIMGSSYPLADTRKAAEYYADLLSSGAEAFISQMEEDFGIAWTPEARADFQSNDLMAHIAMLSSEDLYWPEFAQQLQLVTLPCLILVGEDDGNYAGAKDCARHLPDAKLVSFEGLDHMGSFCRTDVVLPHVRRFLAEVDEGKG